MKFRFLLLCLFYCPVFAQTQQKSISISQLLYQIQASSADTFLLENTYVSANLKTEERFLKKFDNDSLARIYLKQFDTIRIDKKVIFRNVKFQEEIRLRKIRFQQEVLFEKTDLNAMLISGSRFVKPITFHEVKNYIYLLNNTFEQDFSFENASSYILISGCRFKHDVLVSGMRNGFRFDNCTFEGDNYFRNYQGGSSQFYGCQFLPRLRKDSYYQTYCTPLNMYEYGFGTTANILILYKCTFKKATDRDIINLASNGFLNLGIENCYIEPVLYLNSASAQKIVMENTTFRHLDMRSFSIPVNNTSLNFSQISQKIVIKNESFTDFNGEYRTYNASTDAQLEDEYNFKEFTAVYAKLLAVYKYRGDQSSYNQCYIEMKDIQTRKAGFDFRKEKNLPNLFSWQLNVFLRFFCDYGTNPARALVVSFYVILFFACIYFLFPSEEDNLSRNRFMQFFQNAVQYFKTDKQLTDFEQEKKETELKKIENFRQNLEETRAGIPKIVYALGKPFYQSVIFFNEFSLWLLRKTDVVKGKWEDLPKKRKIWLSVWVSLYFLGFVGWGLMVRLVNAVALSLNVFVTLGYGEIPAKGFMRYLAVIEGVSGWFLLSIFSVSLISQLL
jgi:hypothetical protein